MLDIHSIPCFVLCVLCPIWKCDVSLWGHYFFMFKNAFPPNPGSSLKYSPLMCKSALCVPAQTSCASVWVPLLAPRLRVMHSQNSVQLLSPFVKWPCHNSPTSGRPDVTIVPDIDSPKSKDIKFAIIKKWWEWKAKNPWKSWQQDVVN